MVVYRRHLRRRDAAPSPSSASSARSSRPGTRGPGGATRKPLLHQRGHLRPGRALHHDRPGRRPRCASRATRLQVGPSSMHWHGRPAGDRRGRGLRPARRLPRARAITLTPSAVTAVELPLTAGRQPCLAALCAHRPDRGRPRPRAGNGRATAISTPISARGRWRPTSRFWTWGRYPLSGRRRLLLRRDPPRRVAPGGRRRTSTEDGRAETIDPPPLDALRPLPLEVRRETRADAGYRPRQVMAMLDAPFYTRAAVRHPDQRRGRRWACTRRWTSTASPRRC